MRRNMRALGNGLATEFVCGGQGRPQRKGRLQSKCTVTVEVMTGVCL